LLLAALTLWQPSVLALTSSDVQSLIEQHPYYDAGGNCSNGDAPVDSTLPATIPDQYAALFNQAAAAFNTSAPLLAAIFLSENSNTWKPFDTKWDTSPSGASGPFQFMPLTWQAYATDGNNDGVKDINNIYLIRRSVPSIDRLRLIHCCKLPLLITPARAKSSDGVRMHRYPHYLKKPESM